MTFKLQTTHDHTLPPGYGVQHILAIRDHLGQLTSNMGPHEAAEVLMKRGLVDLEACAAEIDAQGGVDT